MKKLLTLSGIVVLGFSLIVVSYASGRDVKPEDFYKGKTGYIASGGRPGGGNDLTSRAVTPYLNKHTGATFVVHNKTKASSLEAANYTWSAKPNGLTIGTIQLVGEILDEIMGKAGVNFKMAQFAYLYGTGKEPHIFCVKPGGAYKSIDDIKAGKDLKFGGTTVTGNITLGSMTVADLLNPNAKTVAGFKGTSSLVLAINQEEVVGAAFTLSSGLRNVKKGKLEPLFVLGMERSKAIPDVPALTELMKLPKEKEEILKVWDTMLVGATVMFVGPGVPKDRVAFLRSGLEQTFKQPEFQDKINKIKGYRETDYLTGNALTKVVTTAMANAGLISNTFNDYIKRYVR